MKRISSLLSIALFSLFTYPLFAQVNIADSLALVDFYIATNGPGWDLDNNWLTADSVDDWLGITVSDIQGTDRVTAINIQGNNLQGELPQSLGNLEFLSTLNLFGNQIVSFPEIVGLNPIVIDLGSNALTALPSFTGYTNTATLLVDGNQLTNLPDLLNLPSLQTFWVQNNNLTFVDLFQGNQFQLPDYQYAPQNPFSAQTQYFKDGASYDICNFFPDIATGNQYQWFDESGNPLTGVSPSTCLTLEIFGADLTGTYVQVVTNPNLPDLTLIGTLDIVVLFEEEPGACYNPLEFIVQFVPGASEDNIANLEAVLTAEGATKIKECLCGDVLQLWTAPTVTEVEGRKGSAEDQLDVDTTGNNYSLFIILSQETGGTENVWSPPNFDGSPDPNVKVGVIDTGIGPDIEDTAPVIWTNEQELVSPGLDDDGNCLIDEIEGYDFQNSTNVVVDGSIHGSHVSGIVANDFPADVDLDIMDLRVHDGETGFLFDAACAIY
ncbi:MAG: S8 family serine peptidase, partial [Bacteroidota bacterium]